ncbi:Serine carboxypeptidase-like 20 [Lathyrus oleraceus]|uniref:Serine carboxypeptidase-like 20 n=1 Tax=Pisum sativum TaxID=3888 RepID=A0A9D5B554_PEA|nr:Serine carboxypeptidase-like 20 [Pisum sativum]
MIDEMCSLQTMVPGSHRLWDALDHAQQAARVFKNRSSLRSTLLEAPSVLEPNYEWMSVIGSRACWNNGNGQRVKMLGDNWFPGQAEFEVWSPASTLVIRLIEDDANNGNSPKGSLITNVPGFNGSLPSKHYGGYVTIDESHGKNLYYYFVQSEGDSSKDPIVLWLNGGPGCSSFDGFDYLIVNPVADEQFDGNALVPFAHGMGLISDQILEV